MIHLVLCFLQVQKGRIRWYFKIIDLGEENNFLSGWVKYFGMLMSLKHITFPSSDRPMNVDPPGKPDMFTFSDVQGQELF